jgi:hypothetical protein
MGNGQGQRGVFSQLRQLDSSVIDQAVAEIFLKLSWSKNHTHLHGLGERENRSRHCVTLLQAFYPPVEWFHGVYSSATCLIYTKSCPLILVATGMSLSKLQESGDLLRLCRTPSQTRLNRIARSRAARVQSPGR